MSVTSSFADWRSSACGPTSCSVVHERLGQLPKASPLEPQPAAASPAAPTHGRSATGAANRKDGRSTATNTASPAPSLSFPSTAPDGHAATGTLESSPGVVEMQILSSSDNGAPFSIQGMNDDVGSSDSADSGVDAPRRIHRAPSGMRRSANLNSHSPRATT